MNSFSITPEGVISYDDQEIGTIEFDRKYSRSTSFVVHGLWIEDQEGLLIHDFSIAAGGAVIKVSDEPRSSEDIPPPKTWVIYDSGAEVFLTSLSLTWGNRQQAIRFSTEEEARKGCVRLGITSGAVQLWAIGQTVDVYQRVPLKGVTA